MDPQAASSGGGHDSRAPDGQDAAPQHRASGRVLRHEAHALHHPLIHSGLCNLASPAHLPDRRLLGRGLSQSLAVCNRKDGSTIGAPPAQLMGLKDCPSGQSSQANQLLRIGLKRVVCCFIWLWAYM